MESDKGQESNMDVFRNPKINIAPEYCIFPMAGNEKEAMVHLF